MKHKVESWFLTLFFLLFIVGCGIASLLRLDMKELDSNKSLRNGAFTHNAELYFDERLVSHSFSVSLWAAVDYLFFKEGKKGVVIGDSDWLYTTEELITPANADSSLQNNVRFISTVASILKNSNIELIVTLIPAKAEIYNQYLQKPPSPFLASMYEELGANLQFVDNLLDLKQEFLQQKSNSQLFLRTDTHWTPSGASLAAERIAQKIREMPLDLATAGFEKALKEEHQWEGDLYSFIPLKPFFPQLAPKPDLFTSFSAIAMDAGDLFGAEDTEIVLVGTSYSANTLWGFESALKLAMGADLVNFAKEGVGPFKPMIEYLESDDFRDVPPKLVIWEIPARYMPVEYALEFDKHKLERHVLSSVEQ